jgi:cytochrome b6-f complex subunit 7
MSAESMFVNGIILLTVLVLGGLAWGFLILKIQGGGAEE